MTHWVGSISFEQRDNWEICKRESLFGSNSVTAMGVRRGDELFIWGSRRGWLARCRATADARRPRGVEEVPWPEPERYTALIPIEVVDEPAEPLYMSGGEIEDTVGIGTIQLPRFPRVDPRRAEHLAALLAKSSGAGLRPDGDRRTMLDGESGGAAAGPLLASLDDLKVDRQLGRPAPYQQLVLLWAISAAVRSRERLRPFSEVRDELRALLRPVAVGENDPDPALPWFALRRSPWWQLSPLPPGPVSRGRDFVRREDPIGGLSREVHARVRDDEEFRRLAVEKLAAALADEARDRALTVLGLRAAPVVPEPNPDATSLLESLIGRTLSTATGMENRVLAVQPPSVLVATGKSPEGQPVPIAMVQHGLDLIRRDGAVTVDVPTLGHRSSFVGAVLTTLPGVTMSGSPPRLALPGPIPDVSRPTGDEEFEDPAIPPGYDERNKAHRTIVQRRGQKAFRDRLLAAYEGTCAVTGTAAEAVLEAAHICPYRGQLHNTVTNGLLLRADIHTLFDLHLLTVLPIGSIRVSPELDGTLYAELDERMIRRSASPAYRPSAAALEEHNAACPWLVDVPVQRDRGASCGGPP